MDKVVYKGPGGIVTKEGKDKWSVTAPDGRLVGKFPTKEQALQKAEHWDKWDALASLQDICMAISPFTTLLMLSMLGSIKEGEIGFQPTNEQLQKAATLDFCHFLAYPAVKQGKLTEDEYIVIMKEAAEKIIKEE